MVTYTDQQIRDKGILYLPKQEYLQDEYQFPVAPVPPPASGGGGGITNTNAFNSGNDDFSVYNPDPNRTRNESNYNARVYMEANPSEFFNLNNPNEMSGLDPKQLKGIPGLAQKYLKNSIPGQLIGNVIGGINNLLPVNRRAILENELLGQGFQLNDIGQFVSDGGNINTAGNIMAGYNASKVDKDTFKKRRLTIEQNMKDPVQKKAKLDALNAAEEKILGTATNRANMVFDAKSLKKDPSYVPFDTQLDINNMINQEKEEDENIIDPNTLRYITKKKAAKTAGNTGTTGTAGTTAGTTDTTDTTTSTITGGGRGGTVPTTDLKNYTPRGPNQPDPVDNSYEDQSYDRPSSGGGASYSNSAQTGAKDGFTYGLKKGGRAGYFFGGRVNYKKGGRINFKGGGADMGATDRAQERADRGYGSTAPADDRSSQQQTDNNDRVTGRGNDNFSVTMVDNNPIDISTVTRSLGDYNIPVGLEALMKDKGRLQAVLNADDILNKNLGAEFTYDQGPYQVGFNADMEGDKSLNANYTRNNSNYSFDLNDGGGQLKFTKTFANGGLAGLL